MVEAKLTGKSMEQRISDRLKGSGDAQHSDVTVRKGESPERTISHVHHTRNQQYGEGHPGEGDIFGRKRGVV